MLDYFITHWKSLVVYVASLFIAYGVAWLLRLLLTHTLFLFLRKQFHYTDKNSFHRATRPATILLFFLLASLISATPALPDIFSPESIRQLLFSAVLLMVGWQVIALIGLGIDFITHQYNLDEADNLQARKVTTQMVVLRRLLNTGVMVVTLASIFMLYPTIRNLGAGLFASAGVIGLIAGMAARPILGNLIAGLQIAFTQPIRIDDVVIIEGEWGWIEEIHPTFVVVKIWDLRRLVVPLSHFIEKPFQNWTRETADILGSVFIYTDYTVPVPKVRQKLHDILSATPLWDGKVWNLQVTNAKEQTLELRALMSAPNSPQAWDLRCHVREELIAFLQQAYPNCLPKLRATMESRPTAEHT